MSKASVFFIPTTSLKTATLTICYATFSRRNHQHHCWVRMTTRAPCRCTLLSLLFTYYIYAYTWSNCYYIYDKWFFCYWLSIVIDKYLLFLRCYSKTQAKIYINGEWNNWYTYNYWMYWKFWIFWLTNNLSCFVFCRCRFLLMLGMQRKKLLSIYKLKD